MNNYDKWNIIKKDTQKININVGIKPREIFWLKIGQNLGDEEFGKDKYFVRPVIVIKQLTKDLFIGVPTTTAPKESNDYFHNIEYFDKKKKHIKSSAMIYQFKTFSKKRLLGKIAMIHKNDFIKIVDKLQKVIVPTC